MPQKLTPKKGPKINTLNGGEGAGVHVFLFQRFLTSEGIWR